MLTSPTAATLCALVGLRVRVRVGVWHGRGRANMGATLPVAWLATNTCPMGLHACNDDRCRRGGGGVVVVKTYALRHPCTEDAAPTI